MVYIKQWACEIAINFNQFGIEAETEKEFIQIIKEFFNEEYNIYLNDSEIANIQEIK